MFVDCEKYEFFLFNFFIKLIDAINIQKYIQKNNIQCLFTTLFDYTYNKFQITKF